MTAIEQIEGELTLAANVCSNSIAISPDLMEVLRLAKLGERVEQCEFSEASGSQVVEYPGGGAIYADDLLAWIREGS